MLSGYRPAFIVGIISGAILSVMYLASLSIPFLLIFLIMPVVWAFYFCTGALGVLSDVKSYRQSIRGLVAGAISGGTAGLIWSSVSLTILWAGMYLSRSVHQGAASGILISSLLDLVGALAEVTMAILFGAAGGIVCLIGMVEVQK